MTDPFFKGDITTQQHLLDQQREIEENFKKLKALFSDDGLSLEQKQQIKNKLLELKEIYSKNKQTLIQMGVDPTMQGSKDSTNTENATEASSKPAEEQKIHVNKVDVKEDASKNRSFNFNTILIGCGGIFLLMLGGVAFLFYYMITHPAQLKNIGLEPADVKRLLQTFTTVFFGIISIVGFILFVMNIYRLFNSKRRSKIGFIFGMLLGISFLGGGVVLGYMVMEKVNAISPDDILGNSNLVRPYIVTKKKNTYIGEIKAPLVGPMQLKFGLNSSLLTKQVLPKIKGKVNTIKLLCGNGQELSITPQSEYFNGICFYRNMVEKGYPLEVVVGYLDAQTSEQQYHSINVGNITLDGIITMTGKKGKTLNPGKDNEILGGIAGDTVNFDASELFRNLGISDYTITWDLDGDGKIDRENETNISYRYTVAGVYTVAIRIPSLGDHLYTFPIRIEQADIPVGDIEDRNLGNNSYVFSVNFFENTKTITKYLFQVLDKDKNSIKKEESTMNTFSYTFDNPGTYYIKTIFVTQDGKQGEILSNAIEIQNNSIADFEFKVFSKSYTEDVFSASTVQKNGDNNYAIELTEIPSVVQIQVDRKYLESKGYHLTAKKGDQPLVFADNKIDVEINTPKTHTISLLAKKDDNTEILEKTLIIKITREGVVGKMNITPDTVGTSPFTVRFDASASKINDPEDEIVYFSWDFGDGKIKKNISESVIEHVYYYDVKKNSGEYYPTLKIKTRKGREYLIGEGTMILVKQPLDSLKIHIDSHPGQVAEVGDIVKFSLEADGLPTKIQWDFGDGKNSYECRGRECIETKKIYYSTGEYKIKVNIEYENRIPLEGDITLRVK
ncbi:MAG: hypothetical protein CR971_02230 [candidate division SR1 bacterium]|nr:MAG: hypothetical protein CR971_02230 [candidate division SR1 bacterium]